MQEVTDLIQDYIATTGTVIVSAEIKNYSTDKVHRPYDVDEDLCSEYPELYTRYTIG
jgi:hypothetical protein